MSLYFDAAAILTAPSAGGSFKSRIYSARNLRASPAQIYALITEASKWDRVLAEVIEKADILSIERKLTPLLALLLVYDHLLSKKGIAAPAAHPLRQAVERHKNRLKAEFTKARVRRGCATVEQFKAAVLREKREADGTAHFVYPRWVRVNNIRSSLEEQLRTTFKEYQRVDTLAALAPAEDDRTKRKLLYVDPHIPDLVAVPFGADFTSSPAYKNGEIILQDKASCFPAYLLLGDRGSEDAWQGDLVDGCAAPGNKTTHMASLLAKQQKQKKPRKQIFSMDASKVRSKTLQKMVSLAGADPMVTVLQGQDFLALDPMDSQFEEVSGLLLDPSCSGSGIVGRDDVPQLTLPQLKVVKSSKPNGKKRKRGAEDHDGPEDSSTNVTMGEPSAAPSDENDIPSGTIDNDRLTKLSNLQARIVEHALSFPNATHVTYSTCSIHLIENEAVVARLLASDVAKERGWRLLRRDEQPEGLRKWKHRGVRRDRDMETGVESEESASVAALSEEDLEACLRCWSGDAEGLGGFFVAGFVRDSASAATEPAQKKINHDHIDGNAEGDITDDSNEDEEWDGFSD
ncbi:25S rRNA [Penicillium rolfsii]|nr:25S rRNA [Penicillium rolfsii]